MSGADNNVLERLGVVNGVVQSSLKLGEREREGKKKRREGRKEGGSEEGESCNPSHTMESCPY